jgi:ferrous iron transport protein B
MSEVIQVALLGHPNVGKSVVFSKLTRVNAITSNYPGTTVEFQEGRLVRKGQEMVLYDLPGTYGLTGATQDELVATRLLSEKRPDCVVVIADASRLEPGLVLLFQVIELGYRTVFVLNQMDEARKRFKIDIDELRAILKVPIVPTVAITGEGLEDLVDVIITDRTMETEFKVRYDSHIEEMLVRLSSQVPPYSISYPQRGALLQLLEGNQHFTAQFSTQIKTMAVEEREKFKEQHGEDIEVHINRDRYGEAGHIITGVVDRIPRPMSRKEKLSDLTLRPWPGIPILIGVLLGVFLTVVFVGGFLETVLVSIYTDLTAGFFSWLADEIGGPLGEAISDALYLTFLSIVAIVIPYIILFYIILAALEDSGYLPRVVILLDSLMRKIGLSGQSAIPMVVGTGCNVPAILSTRVLSSRRERLILASVIILAVPCSAQTVVILGTVGRFVGLLWVAAIYAILLALIIIAAWLMNRAMKEEPIGLMFQVPDLAIPKLDNVLRKTYHRTKDFFIIAFPILLVTSLVLELLMAYGQLDQIVAPLQPITVVLLGLPPITIIALLFGILRKEMSLQLLVVLFGTTDFTLFMTSVQLFVFALVMATYFPCVSALGVLFKEFGTKDSVKITLGSLAIALTLGGAANYILTSLM